MSAIDVEAASTLAATLKALADPLRLRMLSAIATDPRGESCVCDLTELADVSQPTVSHHLRVLREVGVVTGERRGTWVWYRIPPERRPAVTSLLESFGPLALDRSGAAELDAPAALADVDAELSRLSRALSERFPAVHGDLVTSVVRESYTALARRAPASSPLLPLAADFATQRLTDLVRDRTDERPHVLFVCVANAGRSQLAAALLHAASRGDVVARSAGSAPAAEIHARVRPLLDEALAAAGHDGPVYPKPLTDDAVRAADVVITLGCGDVCPLIPGVRYEDWPVADPAWAPVAGVAAIRDDLARRVENLLSTLAPARRKAS